MKEEIVDSEEYTADGGQNEANETSIAGKGILNDYEWPVAGANRADDAVLQIMEECYRVSSENFYFWS